MEKLFDEKLHHYVNEHCTIEENKAVIFEKYKDHMLSNVNIVIMCKILEGDLPRSLLTELDKILIAVMVETIKEMKQN